MTRPTDPAQRDPIQETEYVRKLLLGLMSTLESKGLMTETEIGVIVRAAGQAVYATPAAPARASAAAPATPSDDGPQAAVTPTPPSPPLLDFTLD